MIGTRTVSLELMAPDLMRAGRLAKAAAEVGSQKRPSEVARRDCQDLISESAMATASPPESRRTLRT